MKRSKLFPYWGRVRMSRVSCCVFIILACSVLPGRLLSQSVTVCLSLAGVSKAVENINKVIAPALVRNQVGLFIV